MKENSAKIGKMIAIIFAAILGIVVIFVMVERGYKNRGGLASSVSTEEQVYDKHNLSFTYPANFVITNDDYEEYMLDVLCEVKGTDLAQIEITRTYGDEYKGISASEKREMCYSTINEMVEELKSNVIFRLAKFDYGIQSGYLGSHPCYQKTFSVTAFSVKVRGSIKMTITDDGNMLLTVAMYEDDSYKTKIEQIENSIRLQ